MLYSQITSKILLALALVAVLIVAVFEFLWAIIQVITGWGFDYEEEYAKEN